MTRKRKYTKEFLEPFVKQSNSYAELIRLLNLKQTGGIHRLITMRIKEYGINVSHFTGQLWSKGKTKESDQRIRKQAEKISTPIDEIFCKNSGYSTSKLLKKLLEIGWEYKCNSEDCGLSEWLGKPIRLHVDHKNGDHSDNRLKNLQILCPNCHQQTETWGSKKTAE